MEALLHYIWQHRLFPHTPLFTTQGESVEVIDVGLHNTDAGPDFFNAKIRIDGQLWVGNVEIHQRSSDWYRHNHEKDAHYDNVILHVVQQADREVSTLSGRTLPQLLLDIPTDVERNYQELMLHDAYPPCHRLIHSLPLFEVHAWLSALTVERLEQKTERIGQWLSNTQGDWERVAFIALARAFGFGKNSDAFEHWAATLHPQHMGKHRDHPFQIEALFFGQAGFLNAEAIPSEDQDEHFRALQQEYHFLRQKFGLSPLSPQEWRFLRLRPHNFPYVRLAQLAAFYSSQRFSLSNIRQTKTIDDADKILMFSTLPYWKHRYSFKDLGNSTTKNKDNPESPSREKSTYKPQNSGNFPTNQEENRSAEADAPCLSKKSRELLLINAVIPLLFAYGKHHQDEALIEKSLSWLEQIKAEHNHITKIWSDIGIAPTHAADSQALLQLKLQYCDRRDCLRCRFGTRYLQRAQEKR